MLASLGLGGDGDEIDAIERVEHTFSVRLDTANAPRWLTVGDVWTSLLNELPTESAADPETWQRFCIAIAYETDVDPAAIASRTALLA